MSKTYRRANRADTHRQEPYSKKVKHNPLDQYKGCSSEDFSEVDEDEETE